MDRNGSTADRERNLDYSTKGTYGTSGFMTPEEMHQVLDLVDNVKKTKGQILGRLGNKALCLPENTRINSNVAVYGASGSMKSRAYVRNAVFQCVARGESMILTDTKSELYEDLAVYLENNGYTVRVFNLVSPEHSDSWNCLMEIGGSETVAQIFADVIIQNTGTSKGDHFWDNAELNLLKALILYVEQGFPPESKNIGQVYKLLTMSSEKELNALFDLLPVSHPAKVPYCIYKQASETVRSGVIIGLGSRLQIFQNKIIRQITSYDEIDLTLPGREKCAYFCIVSDQDHSFDFLSSLFLSFIFIKLVRYADIYCEGGCLPVPVHILADELGAAAGTIVDLPTKISVIRSRRISISCIFQNLPQMQNRYPFNAWQEILGNCDTTVFLGCTDPITANFISARSGIATVSVNSEAKQLNSWRVSDYTPEYRRTQSIGKRPVLTEDQQLFSYKSWKAPAHLSQSDLCILRLQNRCHTGRVNVLFTGCNQFLIQIPHKLFNFLCCVIIHIITSAHYNYLFSVYDSISQYTRFIQPISTNILPDKTIIQNPIASQVILPDNDISSSKSLHTIVYPQSKLECG